MMSVASRQVTVIDEARADGQIVGGIIEERPSQTNFTDKRANTVTSEVFIFIERVFLVRISLLRRYRWMMVMGRK